ncbi:alpha/beta fold hydrolase [Agromyces salentinus]|uniref:Alpha/beta hydrolase n=1 Tax=Agromyces salentinus TaxID=269421 RepID=A0ABN2MHL2_9MICO|nr:alpha/beta hydrolase [Agromyces salentinus]
MHSTTTDHPGSSAAAVSFATTPTRTVTANGVDYAYRELGPSVGVPLVLLTHLAATLDNWDPRVVDGLAANRRVIVFDNRGVGASTGTPSSSIEDMARDAVSFIAALGFDRVDLLGLSMGGMVAQVIAVTNPALVRKIVLAGTGPAGGVGIDRVSRVSNAAVLRGILTFSDPKTTLFFTRTANGKRAAREFLARIAERTVDRDAKISTRAYRAQLAAVHDWGTRSPADLSKITQPVLVANGEHDTMVPTENSVDLVERLPDAELVLYPDAGHAGIFQFHAQFVATTLEFLAR